MKRRGFLATAAACTIGGCQTTRGSVQPETIYAKVDLHAHLYHDGSEDAVDGHTTDTTEMVETYEALGYDVLVGTDHHYDAPISLPGTPDGTHVIDYQQLDFDGPILNGVELSTGAHVNLVRSENEEIRQINHPMAHGFTAEGILDLADQIGADLVETTSRGKRLADYPTPTDVVEELPGLTPTMTSDAHSVEEIEEYADNHVIVEVPELTGDEVIRALKRGDYSLSTQY